VSQGIDSVPAHAGAPPVPAEVVAPLDEPELVDAPVLVAVEEVAPPVPVVVPVPVPEPPAPSVNSSSPKIAPHPVRAVPVSASPIHFAFSFMAAPYQSWGSAGVVE
jgi:hypothetical protein